MLGVPQVEEVEEALVAHLLVRGEHDDVAAEVEATGPDGGAGLQQGQLFTCQRTESQVNPSNVGWTLNDHASLYS